MRSAWSILYSSFFVLLIGCNQSNQLEFYITLNDKQDGTRIKNCYAPEKWDIEIKYIFTVDTQKQLVNLNEEVLENNQRKNHVRFLDECKIIDVNNFECGGKIISYSSGNFETTEKLTVANGILYMEDAITPAIVKSDPTHRQCIYTKSIFGFKKINEYHGYPIRADGQKMDEK